MDDTFIDMFSTFDSPIPYKKLEIYPVPMKHYYIFNTLATCLLLEKNSITDPATAMKAISMSYLEYLFFVSNEENKLLYLLDGLLRLVLKKENEDFSIRFSKNDNNKRVIIVDKEIYDASDFNEIRQIIAKQNMLDLPNEKIQKEVRDNLDEARRFKARLNKSSVAPLEEQLMALSMYSGWKLEEIYELTIRKFILGIRRANHMIMSNIYLTASMSGFVKFKNKDILKGWLADIRVEDEYSDVKMTPEELAGTASFESAKNN